MDIEHALVALSALSQETRLRLYRILIEYGASGLAAGALAEQLSIPHNTLSFHLSQLSHAGLVTSRRQGRSIIYSANCAQAESLVAFLMENCCVREEGKVVSSCSAKPRKASKATCC